MDSFTKLFWLSVGIFMLCGIVTLGSWTLQDALAASRKSTERINQFTAEISQDEISRYDGEEVKGSDIVNCIKKYLGDLMPKEEAPLYINVITNTATNQYVDGSYIENISDFTDKKYINPLMKFKGKIVKDKNNVIVGISFTQG